MQQSRLPSQNLGQVRATITENKIYAGEACVGFPRTRKQLLGEFNTVERRVW